MGEDINFSDALALLKEGKKVARRSWNNPSIFVRVQRPDENSMNTEPYLVMEKLVNGVKKVFPLDLSCESIFAEDWFVV
jgi:hypothetical protein